MSAKASANGCDLIVFPALCITGHTNADLFKQKLLYTEAIMQLDRICEESAELDSFIAVGLPVVHESRMYNCSAVLSGGILLGLVPKTYIPNHGEFYEHRWFFSVADIYTDIITVNGKEVHIGTDIL